MRRSLKILFSLSLLAAPAAPAIAQMNVVHEADKTVYRRMTVITFTDMGVEGQSDKPGATYAMVPQKTHFASLVSLRVNFNDELRRSSDNL